METQDLLGECSLPENWGLDNEDEKDQLRNSDLKALVLLQHLSDGIHQTQSDAQINCF